MLVESKPKLYNFDNARLLTIFGWLLKNLPQQTCRATAENLELNIRLFRCHLNLNEIERVELYMEN